MVVLQMSVFPVNITHQLFPMHGTKFVAKRTAANYMTHSRLPLDYPLLMTQACQLERFPVDSNFHNSYLLQQQMKFAYIASYLQFSQ